MSQQIVPLEGALATITGIRTQLAASVLHLFKSTLVPTASTPLADFTAAEADFDGYTAQTLATWFAPMLSPGIGYMIQSPFVQWVMAQGAVTMSNIIGGCYVVDSTGKLRLAVVFTENAPMQLPGQGIPVQLTYFEAAGP